MKTKLFLIAAVVTCVFYGCAIFQSKSDLVGKLEQFVLSEATQYFNGTLTEQQIIDAAKAQFSGLTLAEIIAEIETILNKPQVIQANTAGIAMTKRPLVGSEKTELQQTAFNSGIAFVKKGGTDAVHAKSLLARRLGYHYRVVPSKIKPLSDPAFDQGVASVTGSP